MSDDCSKTGKREQFASRIGFILMTAGCAIGLGNVWRFPYIAGNYGGAVFVLIYLVFLLLIGFPVMVAELALGRAAQSDLPGAYRKLSSDGKGKVWYVIGNVSFLGNIVLLMFYSVVTGWMLSYCWKYFCGGIAQEQDTAMYFGNFLANWKNLLFCDLLGIAIASVVCSMGVRKGIENAMKLMLGGLFILEAVMLMCVLGYDGACDGIRFFLAPDMTNFSKTGIWPAVHAAMMHAFFTLSLGIGSIAICGSYIGKDRTLASEASIVILLDTFAAIFSGLIIFPACFAFKVQPDQGPSLIFVTLTKVFQNLPGGHWLGLLFFIFMSVAALSTLIAVGENIVAYFMRVLSIFRKKAALLFGVIMSVLSLPCLFGFNLLASVQPMGKGSCILDLEDFIVSDNLLPLGSLAILFFCTRKIGWGMDNFLEETNAGKGMRFPRWLAFYMKWFLPFVIFGLWAHNIIVRFWG